MTNLEEEINNSSTFDDDNEDLEESSFIKPDMVGYFQRVIKPDMMFYENKHIKPKIPLFSKDMKVSNITNPRDFAVLNSAAYLTKFIKYVKELSKPDTEKLQFEDWLAYETNFRLNILSSMNGFERKIEHSQFKDTTKTVIDDRQDNKRRPFLDGIFGKNKKM